MHFNARNTQHLLILNNNTYLVEVCRNAFQIPVVPTAHLPAWSVALSQDVTFLPHFFQFMMHWHSF